MAMEDQSKTKPSKNLIAIFKVQLKLADHAETLTG
jgi:hypothetical protein